MSAPKYDIVPETQNGQNTKYNLVNDHHTLFIEPNGASPVKVRNIISTAVRSLSMHNPEKAWNDSEHFLVHWLTDKDGTPKGTANVYIRDVAVYNCLIGRNPDGKSRTIKDLSEELQAKRDKEYAPFKKDKVDSWKDDTEYELIQLDEKWDRICHLVKTPGYVYIDSKQSKDWKNYVKADEIAVMRRHAKLIREGMVDNVLTIGNLPKGTDPRDIRDLFAYFNNSTNPKYPICKVTPKHYIIEYDPQTKDGIFAFMMTLGRKINLPGQTNPVAVRVGYGLTH